MDYSKVELTPSNQSRFAALSKDFIDLFIMISNILHPEIFGKHMTMSFLNESLLSQISGSFLFPRGPFEIVQCYEYIKKVYKNNEALNYDQVIKTFDFVAMRLNLSLKRFTWQSTPMFMDIAKTEMALQNKLGYTTNYFVGIINVNNDNTIENLICAVLQQISLSETSSELEDMFKAVIQCIQQQQIVIEVVS